MATRQVTNATFEVAVTYPTRNRYWVNNQLEVTVHTLAAQPLPRVEVRFAKAYMDQFSGVNFTPLAERITNADYIVSLSNLQPAETRVVNVTLQGDHYGRHQGVVTVSAVDVEPVEAAIATWIFP